MERQQLVRVTVDTCNGRPPQTIDFPRQPKGEVKGLDLEIPLIIGGFFSRREETIQVHIEFDAT